MPFWRSAADLCLNRAPQHWQHNEVECQEQCALNMACVAFEFAVLGKYRRCEIHFKPVMHVLPTGAIWCRIKP
eukprot:1051687-Pleurochrysis_carterae.AAC.1